METENDNLLIDNDTRLNEDAVEEARRFLEERMRNVESGEIS